MGLQEVSLFLSFWAFLALVPRISPVLVLRPSPVRGRGRVPPREQGLLKLGLLPDLCFLSLSRTGNGPSCEELLQDLQCRFGAESWSLISSRGLLPLGRNKTVGCVLTALLQPWKLAGLKADWSDHRDSVVLPVEVLRRPPADPLTLVWIDLVAAKTLQRSLGGFRQ